MKLFQWDEIFAAYDYAKTGGQALHVHEFTQSGHNLFRNRQAAHLFDQDVMRLEQTAKNLGVKAIKIEHPHTHHQHIDLCCRPLEKAIELCKEQPSC